MSSGLETGEESWLLFHGLLGTDWALSLELDGDGMTCAVGMEPCERRGWKHSVPLELEWSSTLSEQDVPMPVSALSEAALWRLARLLLLTEDEPCHADSQPGTHPGEDALEPAL